MFFAACGSEECSQAMRCNGRQPERCGSEEGWFSEEPECARTSVCVETDLDAPNSPGKRYHAAFCALSSTRDPKCDGTTQYCSDGFAVLCHDGYAVRSTPCSSPDFCASDGTCVDPRCASKPDWLGSICEDKTVVLCSGGRAITQRVCPRFCVTAPGGTDDMPDIEQEAFCTDSSEPDPSCGSQPSYCDGDTFVGCHKGFSVARGTCSGAGRCVGGCCRACGNDTCGCG
jgi:hypothetical protein